MDGILRLNDYDINSNAAIGSHDPSMMWDPVTRMYYSYATDSYMPYCGMEPKTGIPVRSSEDLVHFRYEGTVLSEAAIRGHSVSVSRRRIRGRSLTGRKGRQ